MPGMRRRTPEEDARRHPKPGALEAALTKIVREACDDWSGHAVIVDGELVLTGLPSKDLPEHIADALVRELQPEAHASWFRSLRNGETFAEASDPAEVRERSKGMDFQRLDMWTVTPGWAPWEE